MKEAVAPMVVLTGASGLVGGAAIAALRRHGHEIKALTSTEASAARLAGLGVRETVLGDFRSNEDLKRLLQGAQTVVHIPPAVAPDENRIGLRMVEAATAARVDHFVFISCFHPQIAALRHHRNKLAVEDALIRSGLTYTILQPAMFMQNLNYIWSRIEAEGVFEWPWAADKKYTMLDTEDLGEAIAAVVGDPRLHGGTYELCSPSIVTVIEMAEILGTALGRPIRAGRLDPAAWAVGMRAGGAPAWSIETVMGMCRYHDLHGYDGGNPLVLEAVIGRKARSYQDFALKWAAKKAAQGGTSHD